MFKNLLIAMTLCLTAAHFADAQSLTLINHVGTQTHRVSDDGRTIVFRGSDRIWTAGAGLQPVSTFVNDPRPFAPTAISRDGKTLAGANSVDSYAWRWSQQDGFQDLGFLPNHFSDARGVSAVSVNGSVVVGAAINANGEFDAFRWTVQTGMVSIGRGGTSAISDDGSVIVGTNFGQGYAFRWTQQTGEEVLPVPAGFYYAVATDASADGNVVVGGMSTALNEPHVFRWTAATGMLDLGISGDNNPACSADGSIVVGAALRDVGQPGPPIERAFIWDQAHGLRWLNELAISQGIDVQDFQMEHATDISGDGRFIVGVGGFGIRGGPILDTSFLLDLGPVPEPAAHVLAFLALLAIKPRPVVALRGREQRSAKPRG